MLQDYLDYKNYHISIYKDVDYENCYYCEVYIRPDDDPNDYLRDEPIDNFCVFMKDYKGKTMTEAVLEHFEKYIESEVE